MVSESTGSFGGTLRHLDGAYQAQSHDISLHRQSKGMVNEVN